MATTSWARQKGAILGALPGLAWPYTSRQLSGPWLGTVNGTHLSLCLLALGLLPGPLQLPVSSRELLAQQPLLGILQRQGLGTRRQGAYDGAGEQGSRAEVPGLPLKHNRVLSLFPARIASFCLHPLPLGRGDPEFSLGSILPSSYTLPSGAQNPAFHRADWCITTPYHSRHCFPQ